ncbi:MAG: prolipoprotein diacylglyceryl transferase [Gammaproteobacteria bacterium]
MIITLPDFFNNPSLLEIGSIRIQYYALTWALSAVLIFLYLKKHPLKKSLKMTDDDLNDLIFMYGLFFGAMLGGRIGYMFFYGLDQLLSNPLSILFVWEGGLSFHGGLMGVILSIVIFAKQKGFNFWDLADMISISIPIGLFWVRIGNFLNGELYGRPTDGSWGFIFPTDPFQLPRHPSQLYEGIYEGIVLFLALMFFQRLSSLKAGALSGIFLISYGFGRFIIEFFRQPDWHIGFVLSKLTMGQMLCIPMVILGIFIILRKNETVS